MAGQFRPAVEVGDLPGPSAARVRAGRGVVRAGRQAARDADDGWVVACGRRMVAIHGTCLDVADTVENAKFFGRPGVNKGEQAAFPQARMVALAECGTHAVFAAEIGAYSESEATLTERLLPRLEPGMVLLADRGFSYALWRKASATGADLLWRIRTDTYGPRPAHVQDLEDGSWLALLQRSTGPKSEPMQVRVVDYTVDDGRGNATSYRLFTTLLDPLGASAVELAAAYNERWEIELILDELKTHQRGPRTVLRSKSPDLVRQEIWGQPVLPLCDPHPDGRHRAAQRPRPRPGQLRRRPAHRPPVRRPQGRFSPLTTTAPPSTSGSPRCAV
jgi:hypothetical protein